MVVEKHLKWAICYFARVFVRVYLRAFVSEGKIPELEDDRVKGAKTAGLILISYSYMGKFNYPAANI